MIFCQIILAYLIIRQVNSNVNPESRSEVLRSRVIREFLMHRPQARLLNAPRQFAPAEAAALSPNQATWRDDQAVIREELFIDSTNSASPAFRSPSPDHKKSSSSHPDYTHSISNPLSEPTKKMDNFSDVFFVAIVAGCSAAAIIGVIGAGICFYKIQQRKKAAADVEYPAYGVTGPGKESATNSPPNGDRKLAQSAHMYHYQHQKQQMIAVEKARHGSASDGDSEEEENEEGDYTVYECPGLASTVEMEVKNPLFQDDSTPISPPTGATNNTSPSTNQQ